MEAKYHVGIPILSSLRFGVSNSFALKDVVDGTGSETKYNMEGLLNSFKGTGYLNLNTSLEILNIGFKVKDRNYINITLQEMFDGNLLLENSLFEFLYKGNGHPDFLGKTTTFDDLGIKAINYTKLGVAYTRKVDDKLSFGARPSFYIGRGYLNTGNSQLSIYTAEDALSIKLSGNIGIEQSGTGFLFDEDEEFDAIEYLTSTGNKGLGIDLGGNYKINSKISVSASVIDFGFISWKESSEKLESSNIDITYNGFEVSDLFGDGSNSSSNNNEEGGIADSLINQISDDIELKTTGDKFRTGLPTKIYLGGQYELTEKIHTGLLYQGRFINKKMKSSVSLSSRFTLAENVSTLVSYTMTQRSYNNIGLGFAANLGPFQFYFAADNLFGLTRYDYAKVMNFRFGINIRQRVKKDTGESLL